MSSSDFRERSRARALKAHREVVEALRDENGRLPYETTGKNVGVLYYPTDRRGVYRPEKAGVAKGRSSADPGRRGIVAYGKTLPSEDDLALRLPDEKRVLQGTVLPGEASENLRSHVRASYSRAALLYQAERQKEGLPVAERVEKVEKEAKKAAEDPLMWKIALDAFATREGYEAITFGAAGTTIRSESLARRALGLGSPQKGKEWVSLGPNEKAGGPKDPGTSREGLGEEGPSLSL